MYVLYVLTWWDSNHCVGHDWVIFPKRLPFYFSCGFPHTETSDDFPHRKMHGEFIHIFKDACLAV